MADLAIGAPGDELAVDIGVGSEIVLYGSLFADGFDSGTLTSWSLASP